MTGVSPITRQTVGRTFIVAICALGVGAFIQVVVVVWLFFSHFRTTPPPAAPAAAVQSGAPVAPAEQLSDPFADSAPGSAAGTPVAAQAAAASAKPTPIPAQALPPPAEQSPVDRYTEAIEQGKILRERGDTYAAVTKLREAQTMDPTKPQASAELAMTYEKMGFVEKAAESWRRVYEMGAAAGVYYAAAEGKLKASQIQALRQVEAAAEPAKATPAPAPAAAEIVGLGPNSRLGLLEISRKDEADASATQKFTLHVPVKAKARARIDVRDVTVQVLFYDVVNNRALDRTNAQVSYRWASPPADWSDEDVETLEVGYTLPVRHASDEERKYYGYVVSVYYKNVLQDFRSDPANLAQRAPPPKMLAPDSNP